MRDDILVVDASVAVKWYLTEAGSGQAQQVLESARLLFAPDILQLEILHVLTKNIRRGVLAAASARDALADVSSVLSLAIPSLTLLPRALDMALELHHSIHDCLYVAAAERWNAPFVTSDATLMRKLLRSPYAPFILDLNDFTA